MIGKIFFKNEWKMCRFEKKILEILRSSCEIPWLLHNINFNPASFTVAEFEDGYFYFFDLCDDLEEVRGEYVQYRFKVPYFFKSIEPFLRHGYNLEQFESVTFQNGVLMPMVTLSKVPEFNIEIEKLNVQAEFRLKEVADEILCALDHGRMLSNYPTKKMSYELVATFSQAVNLTTLNRISKKLYKIIQFISTDYNAPIENLVVKTNIGDLIYYNSDIYLTNESIIKRYNYIGNCGEYIKEIAQNLVEDKCDVSFLSLIDKDELIDNDYWLLGQSLETNVPDNIDKNIQNSEIKSEISDYKKLREKIKKTINDFEEQYGEIDKDRKNFILSLIEIAKFRRKAELAFEKYNSFAKNYSKYRYFNDIELNEFSKQLQLARNTVHGSRGKNLDKEKAKSAATLCVIGLYIYILEQSGALSNDIFNFIQCFYSQDL